MGPIRNPNWSTIGMRVTLSYLFFDVYPLQWNVHYCHELLLQNCTKRTLVYQYNSFAVQVSGAMWQINQSYHEFYDMFTWSERGWARPLGTIMSPSFKSLFLLQRTRDENDILCVFKHDITISWRSFTQNCLHVKLSMFVYMESVSFKCLN